MRRVDTQRDREQRVLRVLCVEAAANAMVLLAKLAVAAATSSTAVLGDAVHSLADLANNGLAAVAVRLAGAPPDSDHPYGHRKFETLAVFALAILLCVLGIEIALRGFGADREVVQHTWSLGVMLGVLTLNVGVASWESWVARRVDSDLLRADARHTISDVLVTTAVIAGWQLAARGHHWADAVAAWVVAGLIFWLAYGLFRRAIPVLVDQSLIPPEALRAVVDGVPGVRATRRVRSTGRSVYGKIDVVACVDAACSTRESHEVADAIERALQLHFDTTDVAVHVEPYPDADRPPLGTIG